jgi:hypothetical protein
VARPQVSKPTAREIIAAIQLKIPIGWDEPTVDTFKARNPDTPVSGIAVTMMATMDVLQRAAAHGDNLIITHELIPVALRSRMSTVHAELGSPANELEDQYGPKRMGVSIASMQGPSMLLGVPNRDE